MQWMQSPQGSIRTEQVLPGDGIHTPAAFPYIAFKHISECTEGRALRDVGKFVNLLT